MPAHRSSVHSRAAVAMALLSALSACGPGPAPEGWGCGGAHVDIHIGSTEPGGGALLAAYDFACEVHLSQPQCIGGSGPECLGGIVLRGTEDPGFSPQERAEPSSGRFVLPAGVEVRLERVDGSPEAGFFVAGVGLRETSDSVVLGAAPAGLHVHGDWQLLLPGGSKPVGHYFITFRLSTDAPGFAPSEPFVVVLHAES